MSTREGTVERLTEDGVPLTDEHCGFCTLHYGIHPRYKSLEHLAKAVERDPESHGWLPPSTYAAVRTAILDEQREAVDGLVNTLIVEHQKNHWVDGTAGSAVDVAIKDCWHPVCASLDAYREAVRATRESS